MKACVCNNISDEEIRELMAIQDLSFVEAFRLLLEARSDAGCGKCRTQLDDLDSYPAE